MIRERNVLGEICNFVREARDTERFKGALMRQKSAKLDKCSFFVIMKMSAKLIPIQNISLGEWYEDKHKRCL